MKRYFAPALPLYFLTSLIFMETLLRLAVGTDGFFSIGLLLSILFSVPVALLFSLIAALLPPRAGRIATCLLLGLAAILFASQLVYFRFFQTYYSLFSAGNAGQIMEFWREIITATLESGPLVLLFLLPLTTFALAGKKLPWPRLNWSVGGALACLLVVSQVMAILAVNASTQGRMSPYSLYYERSYPELAVARLGLITTMRLDLQRMVSGWTPRVEPPPAAAHPPDGNGEPDDDEPAVEYNVLDFDFTALAIRESNNAIRDMHRYFASVPPTEKNEYTGIFAGYNLIFITAEAFSHYAVRQDITPTLYKMVNEGFHFTNFYTPIWGVSTSDGEYVACTGLLPKEGVWSFYRSGSNYMPFAMGNQLRELGYKTVAYHNHSFRYYRRHISHPNMGYEYKGIGNGLIMKDTWPRSDLEMMEITIPEYIDHQPFHAYYMTVSGHLQYNFRGNYIAWKNRHHVQDLPYSEAVRAYLATQIELDRALEHLLNQLEEAGIADRTLIALSSDHYPYGLTDEEIDELAGHDVERHMELHRNTFILYTQGMEPMTVDKLSSSLDIIPTLSNLLGLEYDSRLLMGRDIFSTADPLVIFRGGSFITDKGRYDARTDAFTPAPGADLPADIDDYVDRIIAKVDRKLFFSAQILDLDYYRLLFDN